MRSWRFAEQQGGSQQQKKRREGDHRHRQREVRGFDRLHIEDGGDNIQAAKDAGVPVIAYDRLSEDPDVLYITFDNIGVGKLQAEAIIGQVPTGNYVLIKGDPGDPNASTFLPSGWDQAGLKTKVDEKWDMRTDARWFKSFGRHSSEHWRVSHGVSFDVAKR